MRSEDKVMAVFIVSVAAVMITMFSLMIYGFNTDGNRRLEACKADPQDCAIIMGTNR